MHLYELSTMYSALQAEIEDGEPEAIATALAKNPSKPTRRYLRSILKYNKRTGSLRWKPRPISHFKSIGAYKRWNARYPGKEAGAVDYSHVRDNGACSYRRIMAINDKTFYVHRVIFAWVTGRWPPEVDHKDVDGLNNKWANLRSATKQKNSRNRRVRRDNISGFKGVTPNKKKWMARIRHNGETIQLGSYQSPELAHAAYCKASTKYHGNFGRFS